MVTTIRYEPVLTVQVLREAMLRGCAFSAYSETAVYHFLKVGVDTMEYLASLILTLFFSAYTAWNNADTKTLGT